MNEQKPNIPKNQYFKQALCYVPFGFLVIFLAENNKTPELEKHMRYGGYLLGIYLVLSLFIGWLVGGGFLFLVYAGLSGFLGYKAYTGEGIELGFIDSLEKQIKEKLK